MPAELKGKVDIRISYSFGKTIGSKILNYNKVLKAVGNLSYADIQNMNCSCDESPFKHDHFGHVITGDLCIIGDPQLREVCSFGTKFRENPYLDLNKIREQMKKDTDSFAIKMAGKFKISRAAFKFWKKSLLGNFNNKLMSCYGRVNYRKPVLLQRGCKDELSRLQEDYVITVVDKAACNFAFTCKKFYFLKLAEELGLNNDIPGNETYGFSSDSEDTIITRIKADLSQFRITPNIREERLALLYQTPKFHKNPPKMRYIAGNVSVVTSRLDRIVASVLKMCKGHFKNLCNKNTEFSGIRYFFDVQTSLEVKEMFSKANGQAETISINDFSTLYTLFDHDHLIGNMVWLINKLSKNSGMRLIRIGHEKAWWVSSNSEGVVYSIDEILDMIDYLVRNTFIKAFGSIFKQNLGIIMGGKSSGWLSDCSLMVDEFRYVDSKVKSGARIEAERLEFFRRYRDDCTSLNIRNFMAISSEIYPPSLTLTQENDDLERADVLDMEVRIQDGGISTKVYCKTDAFPFDVISLPFLESNLDGKICYKFFYGQVLRFQRLCSNIYDFEERVRFLLVTLLNRGYNFRFLKSEFCKVINKYISEFQRWVIPLDFDKWFKDISSGSFNTISTQPVN